MRRLEKAALVASTMGVLLSVIPVSAQVRVGGPVGAALPSRPAVSPYVNLNRNNIPPVISYYGIIRPELATANSLQQLQTQQNNLAAQQLDQNPATGLLPTSGHGSGFMTEAKYFLNRGSPGQLGGVGGAPAGGAPKSGTIR